MVEDNGCDTIFTSQPVYRLGNEATSRLRLWTDVGFESRLGYLTFLEYLHFNSCQNASDENPDKLTCRYFHFSAPSDTNLPSNNPQALGR